MRKFDYVSKEQFEKDFNRLNNINMKLSVNIKLPKRSTKESAGYDCFAPYGFILKPAEEITMPTGINVSMNKGEVLLAFPRSGLGFKYYCRLANSIGVIDSDYINSDNEGHIMIKLRNEGLKDMEIKEGEAICQFIFMPFLITDDDNFDKGEDRNGGFGSTTKVGD